MADSDQFASRAMRIFMSVGTDVHPFERLIIWAEAIVQELGSDRVEIRVQHGHSRTPTVGMSWPMLPRAHMIEEFKAADLVIVSCGPGAVMDARSVGKLPIVVARDHTRGEHVDGHQQAFARHLDATGMARNATTLSELLELINNYVDAPSSFTVQPSEEEPAGIAGFGQRVNELLSTR